MAEELIVGGAGEIVNRLISLGFNEIGLLIGVNDEVRKLQSVLISIQEVIQDAEEKQVKERRLRGWLTDLKQVAYDAEDVLDEIAYKELKYTIINKVHKLFCFPNRLRVHSKIAHKIKGINERLGAIDKNKSMFQLINVVEPDSSGEVINDRETSSLVDDLAVIGRESEKREIVDMLTNHRDDGIALSVIPVVGIGGLGKTTLAQLVYNDDEVKKHFDLRVWVCVSTDFNTTNLIFQILEQITRNSGHRESSKQVLQKSLESELSGKKFFIVLDDVWNEDQEKWDDFELPFRKFGATGSKIIVTTRSFTVASVARPQKIFELQMLSDDICWSLFEKRAFMSGGPEKNSYLVEIGKAIVKKCKGVPLAAKVLGGLMHSKKESQWLAVQNSEIWNVIPGEENQITKVLKLSYDNLPWILKSCFLYCAIFSKDYLISRETLIQLWMAQGLLKASSTLDDLIIEDMGKRYFNILYAKSFFQEAEKDRFGEVTHCKMHDLIHDLAQNICGSECQIMGEINTMSGDLSKCRHASFISPATIEALHEAKNVRTIFGWKSNFEARVFGGPLVVTRIRTFFKFKLLRVLDLRGFRDCDFSSLLGQLKHLRYLDLSYTSIKSLPKWVTRLYNLQTLKLNGCRKLTKLPTDLINLKKLRHLFIDDGDKWTKMPQAMGKLHQLQTLPIFVACKTDGISVLENLNNLRGSLEIHRLCLVKEKSLAKKANLINKSNLRELRLRWGTDLSTHGDDNHLHVLEELQPHPNLQWLSIENFGGVQFPAWVSSGSDLPYMVGMDLSNCNYCEHIPSFNGLPRLESLKMIRMSNVKRIGSGGASQSSYTRLKQLVLISVPNLEEWSGDTAMLFPSLTSLVLDDVGGMGVVSIITSLTSLTSLEITQCQDLEFLPEGLLRNNHQLNAVEVSDCPKLQAFQEVLTDEIVANSSLLSLMIDNCDALKSIPNVRGLTSLQYLKIRRCPKLETISKGFLGSLAALESFSVIELSSQSLKHVRCPEIVGCPNCQGFDSLTTEQLVLPCCNTLVIRDCPAISSIDLRSFPSLRELKVIHCRGLQGMQSLPFLTALEKLKIGGFSPALRYFPLTISYDDDAESNNCLTSLRELEIWGWPTLQSLPHQLQHLTMLKSLSIRLFDGLMELPEWLGNSVSLDDLMIRDCPAISSIDLRSFSSLRQLNISNCGGLQALQGLQFLTALDDLHIGPFSEELDCFPLLLGDDGELTSNNPLLPSLRRLSIKGWPALQSLPHHLQRLTMLKSLTIWNFTNLTKLPEWLGNLASLENLTIWNCENLTHLPPKEQMQRLTLLKEMFTSDCPRLKERCSRDGDGPEWPKISHIPHLWIA